MPDEQKQVVRRNVGRGMGRVVEKPKNFKLTVKKIIKNLNLLKVPMGIALVL